MPEETSRRRRRAVPQDVADQLCARISNGELRPGDRLPGERELADQLSVNRSSVREALKKLEQLRLVDIQPGSATRVLDTQQASFDFVRTQIHADDKPSTEWVRDLLELRELVGGGLAKCALERAGSEQLDDLARSVRALADEELAESAFEQALLSLPAYLARVSGNRVLLILTNSVTRFLTEPAASAAGRFVSKQRDDLRSLLTQLADSVEARDSVRAEGVVRDLMRRLGDELLRELTAPPAI